MTHPSPEEWMTYLYGEASPKEGKRLAAHLAACEECGARVRGWRATASALDTWELPGHVVPRPWHSWVRLAAAVALIFGLGFAGGWWGSPSRRSLNNLRAQIETSICADLRREQATAVAELGQQLQSGLREELAQYATGVAMAGRAETEGLLAALIQRDTVVRAREREDFVSLLTELEKRRLAEFTWLRGDVEVLATLAGAQLSRTQQGLAQLAAATMPGRPDAATGAARTSEERRPQ